VTDKNRFDLHLRKTLGKKTPQELVPLDVERLRRHIAKNHSIATTRNVLELLRRVINFGVRQRHYPALDWMIELPKQDPTSERIEVLTPEQFQNLWQVWESYPDRQLSHLHQFIGWTGSRLLQKHLSCSGKTLILIGGTTSNATPRVARC
jgi:hypothetical protein